MGTTLPVLGFGRVCGLRQRLGSSFWFQIGQSQEAATQFVALQQDCRGPWSIRAYVIEDRDVPGTSLPAQGGLLG